jgi:hypothetical protein
VDDSRGGRARQRRPGGDEGGATTSPGSRVALELPPLTGAAAPGSPRLGFDLQRGPGPADAIWDRSNLLQIASHDPDPRLVRTASCSATSTSRTRRTATAAISSAARCADAQVLAGTDPVYGDRVLVITAPGREPYAPVALGEALQAWIEHSDASDHGRPHAEALLARLDDAARRGPAYLRRWEMGRPQKPMERRTSWRRVALARRPASSSAVTGMGSGQSTPPRSTMQGTLRHTSLMPR